MERKWFVVVNAEGYANVIPERENHEDDMSCICKPVENEFCIIVHNEMKPLPENMN